MKVPGIEDFLAKAKPSGDGCLEWQGYVASNGYGRTTKNRKPYFAHRRAYELAVGPIPVDKCIDHLCRNRKCINPRHLEVVTLTENTLRGVGITAVNAKKTHCKRGHEFTEGSYRPAKRGGRRCKECARLSLLTPSMRAWRSEYYKRRRTAIAQLKEPRHD